MVAIYVFGPGDYLWLKLFKGWFGELLAMTHHMDGV